MEQLQLVDNQDQQVPVNQPSATNHRLVRGDSRAMTEVADESVALVVTSPPYWTLKKYPDHPHQLGDVSDFEVFGKELARTWDDCFRVLLPGGRLCVNVGDVTLSRRRHGRHRVLPLHANIVGHALECGFDMLTPIFWWKRVNLTTEISGDTYFLGKPYEPNGIIKSEIEYILLLRKPGAYRKPTTRQRELSRIAKADYHAWYRAVWDDIGGASSAAGHPAPFPLELPNRLIRMFSFVGDNVLDPFVGSGTTCLAAAKAGRHSIGYDVEESYLDLAEQRLHRAKLRPLPAVERINAAAHS